MYPIVYDERDTIRSVLKGRSLSRIGEGELRLSRGQSIKSQTRDPRLKDEIRAILKDGSPSLVCLPRFWSGMPAEEFWRQFTRQPYLDMYGSSEYGSSFVSRPDVVNAIDDPEYWDDVTRIWTGKDAVLASRSMKIIDLSAAASVRFVSCPAVSAYSEIDRIEEEIGRPSGPILLAIGATATALSVRLAKKGLLAIDIGHLGRFMASAGAYSVERDRLISKGYVKQNVELHRRPEGYGGSGYKSRDAVMELASEIGAETVLDYGCGRGTLRAAMKEAGFAPSVFEYDPAIKGKNGNPKAADLVVCTDVLEHIEPDKLDEVLLHLFRLTLKSAYFVIATRIANKTLPDGRNAHLIIEGIDFWLPRVERAGFVVTRRDVAPREIKLWLSK